MTNEEFSIEVEKINKKWNKNDNIPDKDRKEPQWLIKIKKG